MSDFGNDIDDFDNEGFDWDDPEDWDDDDEIFLEELKELEDKKFVQNYVSDKTNVDFDYDYSVDDFPYGYGVD